MPDKLDSSNSNSFNRLTKLGAQRSSIRVLYLAVSQSLEAVSLKMLLAQFSQDGLNKTIETCLKICKQKIMAKQAVFNWDSCPSE